MMSGQVRGVSASRRVVQWTIRLLIVGGYFVLPVSAGGYGYLALRARVTENVYEHYRPVYTNDELANRYKWIESAPREEAMKRARQQAELLEPVAVRWMLFGCALLISGYGLRAYGER